jgi:hypothetical protein
MFQLIEIVLFSHRRVVSQGHLLVFFNKCLTWNFSINTVWFG